MIHIAFFISLLALCTGAVSLTISLFFFLQYRKRVVIWYTAMLIMVMLLCLSRMIELYCTIIGLKGACITRALPYAVEQAGYIIGLAAGPRFCLQLIGIRAGRRIAFAVNGTTLVFGVIAAAGTVAVSRGGHDTLRLAAGVPLLFGTYVILCITAALKLETIASTQLRIAVKLFFVLSLIVLPLALIKYLRDLPYLPWHLENSLALFLITVGSIFFALRFLNQPSFVSKGSLSEHFRNRFGTTSREAEIIQLAVSGMSNSDIADKLFISVRTVESHLYNIFQKTGVKNRVQLINLIAANSSD